MSGSYGGGAAIVRLLHGAEGVTFGRDAVTQASPARARLGWFPMPWPSLAGVRPCLVRGCVVQPRQCVVEAGGGIAAVEEGGGIAVAEEGGMLAGGIGAVLAGGGAVGAVAGAAAPGAAFSSLGWLQAVSANEEASSRLQHSRRIFMAVSFGLWVSAAGTRYG
ncbi:hypothetical protein [Frateuria sp.]|uniref:hypothetical protein n=1 Tax=Frateuria sp. TaxID=2211372 RepID=UPI0017A8BEB4|nr:hypothetical protein [Frateuria sp.]NUR24119.1 hypothetical protein [Frateuria sp.]